MSNLNFLDATPLNLSGRSGISNGLPYSRRTSMEVFLDGMDDMLNGGDDMNMDSFSLSGMSIDDEPLSSSEIEVHRGPQHIMPSEIMINNDCSPATHQRTMSTTSLNSHTSLSSAQRPTNYTEQLQSLAASMKRTEESRRHIVKMKREHLTPAQRAALSTATAQLSKQNQQVMSSSSGSSSSSSQSPQGGSGFMAQLNGVRRTMGGYLGSVNNQTL